MTVSEQIIQVINALCEKFGIAINWTSENVLPYIELLCRKLVTYEVATSIAWIVIWASLSIGGIVSAKKLTLKLKEGIEDGDFDCEFGLTLLRIGLVILSLITLIVVIVQTMDIIKCLTFPEMYIFEYVSRLIQQ